MPYTFFNELGVEPVSYVGLNIEIGELESSIHTLESTVLKVAKSSRLDDSIHSLFSTTLLPIYRANLENSIHKQYTYNKFNSPVNPNCRTYLQSNFADYYLNTEEKDTYLQTYFEDYYLNNKDICT